MGTGRMQPHEVAVLRRSLAMVRGADPEIGRALATAEDLFSERAELRALLLDARGASTARLRQIIGKMQAVLGES